ncbi:unnamed protein product [Effrenium voratum]|nr:unnamed protein product [Effrenium voratum]
MPVGPLGDAADPNDPGPCASSGIKDHYTCFKVARPQRGVLEVILDRPEARNAMGVRFVREMHQICDVLQFPHEEAIRVLIIRGAGPAFCSGFDFKDEGLSRADGPMLQSAFSGMIKKLRELPQPVVCGLNGPAAGAGMSLALAADLRVGTEKCSFVAAFVKLGLGGGELGTSFFLPKLIGRGRASEALLTGRPILAPEAAQWGLLNQLVPSGAELPEACLQQARRLLELSPKGLRLTKWLLNSPELSLSAALEREDLAQVYMASDKECQEVGREYIQKFRKSSRL